MVLKTEDLKFSLKDTTFYKNLKKFSLDQIQIGSTGFIPENVGIEDYKNKQRTAYPEI